jgi:hypothetical protein
LRKISSNNKNSNSKLIKKKRKDKARQKKSREQRDIAKKAEKALAAQLSMIEQIVDSMPKTCDKCEAPFDSANQQHLDSWKMSFNDGVMSMNCEKCQEISDV